jgi:exoribonuclease R
MPQARAMPHAGLGVGLYVQSTSPIRRFTDLLCHYNLKAWLRKQVPPFNRDRLTELATTQVRHRDMGLLHSRAAVIAWPCLIRGLPGKS